MHEMSIAVSLLDQLQRIATDNQVARIVKLEVRCGALQQVVPDALTAAFAAAAEGTAADGAELRIVEVPLAGRCRACGAEYAPQIDDFRCPTCHAADVELTAGEDIVLQSVICEVPAES